MTEIPANLLNTITTGDARELARALPDGSVDLVFTDPVYERIEDYAWLAETAARVLKPGGSLLAFYGIGWLPQTIAAMQTHMQYRWSMGVFQPNGPSRRAAGQVFSKWYACLWFEKSNAKLYGTFPDMGTSIFVSQDGHPWRKNYKPLMTWLRGFTRPDALVFDPFCGGGTVPAVCKMLNRQYVAFEIDAATAERARQRVDATQAMHPAFTAEQEVMALE